MPVTRNQSAFSQGKSNRETSEPAANDESSEPSEEGASAEASRRDSPDNCSICLGPFNNKSFTSSCTHSFCFVCLKQWSKVKAECPLCKQPFTSIFHNIRSNQSYDIYELPPRSIPRPMEFNGSVYNFMNLDALTFAAPPSAAHHHQYFSLSHPSLDADLTLSNFSRFQFRHRRYLGQHHHHHHQQQQQQHPIHGEHQYSYSGVQVNPATHVNGDTWPRGPEEFRREIYRHRLGAPVTVLGMEGSTYRLTPAMVAASSHRLHRIMPWLTRELRVLLPSHQSVRLALSVIQPLLTQFSLDSSAFFTRVTPLLGRRANQFVQQFVAFANSALAMQAFDRRAMYQRPDTSLMLPISSSGSSSSDDDVVEIMSVSPPSNNTTTTVTTTTTTTNINNNAGGGGAEASGVSGSALPSAAAVPSSSTMSGLLSGHGWDSPIPGPSWEMLSVVDDDDDDVQIQEDPVSVSSETDDPVYRPDAREPDSDASKAGSDLVFVKYDKPWNERSPIHLDSSSEAEEPSKKKKKSKHKKKSKDPESKGHKPSLKIKIRRKHKARRSKDNDEDDYEVGSDSTDEESKRRSQSIGSGDRSSSKRHKKSREKSRKSSRKNSDRDLVDRLFAEAITQPNLTSIFQDEPTTTYQAEGVESRQTSGKGKEKRKKKRRGSSSPSSSRAYKKHHSGHKKSSDPNRASHMPSILQRRSPREAGTSGHSSQAESNTAAAGMGMSPSVQHSGPYQPSFLPLPDTVQHIPLNLWVSTWPPLSMSTHAYSSGPVPTSSALPPPLPHALNLSTSRPVGVSGLLASHTISSGSSTDNASEEERASREKNASSASSSRKRTKKWLESNFFNKQSATASGKGPLASVSTLPAATSTTDSPSTTGSVGPKKSQKVSSFSTDFLLNFEKPGVSSSGAATAPAPASSFGTKDMVELVCSSEDEGGVPHNDVLVCSSDNDAGSDTDSSDDNDDDDDDDGNDEEDDVRKRQQKGTKSKVAKASSEVVSKATDQTLTDENSGQTSSRLIAYSKSPHSKAEKQPEPAINSALPANTQNDPEDRALVNNILDFLLDCGSQGLSNVPGSTSIKSTQSESAVPSSATITVSSTSCETSVATVATTVSASGPVVSSDPFYLIPNSSCQSSSVSASSLPPGQGNFLPYPSPILRAPISFPPLLPSHPAPPALQLPEVTPFPLPPLAPLIPSVPSDLFQLCPQGQDESPTFTNALPTGGATDSSMAYTPPQDNTGLPNLSVPLQASDQSTTERSPAVETAAANYSTATEDISAAATVPPLIASSSASRISDQVRGEAPPDSVHDNKKVVSSSEKVLTSAQDGELMLKRTPKVTDVSTASGATPPVALDASVFQSVQPVVNSPPSKLLASDVTTSQVPDLGVKVCDETQGMNWRNKVHNAGEDEVETESCHRVEARKTESGVSTCDDFAHGNSANTHTLGEEDHTSCISKSSQDMTGYSHLNKDPPVYQDASSTDVDLENESI